MQYTIELQKRQESSWHASFVTVFFHITSLFCKIIYFTVVGNGDHRADHFCHHIAVIFWNILGSKVCISLK